MSIENLFLKKCLLDQKEMPLYQIRKQTKSPTHVYKFIIFLCDTYKVFKLPFGPKSTKFDICSAFGFNSTDLNEIGMNILLDPRNKAAKEIQNGPRVNDSILKHFQFIQFGQSLSKTYYLTTLRKVLDGDRGRHYGKLQYRP